MKDRTKATASSPDSEDVKVYDLTPEMAVPDQDKHKIINLVRAVDDTTSRPVTETTEPPQEEKTAPPAVEKHRPEPPPSEPEPEVPAATKTIEKEVDAAFKAAEALNSQNDNQLLDDMTNLTALVDSVIEETADPTQAEEDLLPSDEAEALLEADDAASDEYPPIEIDEEQLAADAAAIESALSMADNTSDGASPLDLTGPDDPEEASGADDIQDDIQMDEEIIELLDMADSEEAAAAENGLPNEEIIELTEMVDRAEKAETESSTTDDTVIELTDVVASAESDTDLPETMPVDELDDEIIELTEIVDPAEFAATTGQDPDEEIIELTEIVDPAELAALQTQAMDDDIIELTEIVDPAELAGMAPTEESEGIIELTDILDQPNQATDAAGQDEDEQLIRLSDVLNPKTRSENKRPEPGEREDETPLA